MELEIPQDVLELAVKKGLKSEVLSEADGFRSYERVDHSELDPADFPILKQVAQSMSVSYMGSRGCCLSLPTWGTPSMTPY